MIQHLLLATDLVGIASIVDSFLDPKTALFLSGGSTPRSLYTYWAEHGFSSLECHPGAIGIVDERFGDKQHEKSNELMVKRTGFLTYVQSQHIPFYPMLQDEIGREKATETYQQTMRTVLQKFPKKVAIMGIGVDAHTAGIAPGIVATHDLVMSYDKPEWYALGFGPRITLTYEALKEFDHLIILAFGAEKKWALEQMMLPGSMEDIPARFYTLPEISEKTILITDQELS